MSLNNIENETILTTMSLDEFLQSVFDLTMTEVIKKRKNRNEPVVKFKKPEELKKILSLRLKDEPQNHEALLKQCSDFIKYSVKTGMCKFVEFNVSR